MVVVLGLRDSQPHWYGLELGSGPSTPILTYALSWRRKRARVLTRGTPVVFDAQAAEGTAVAPLNVRALQVLAYSAVAFSRSAVHPRLVPSVPRCVWPEL